MTVYAESTCNVPVTINSIVIKDSAGNIVLTLTPSRTLPDIPVLPAIGGFVPVGGDAYQGLPGVIAGDSDTVTLVSASDVSVTSSTVIASP